MRQQLSHLRSYFRSTWLGRHMVLETESSWFILMSALDFFMTYILLMHESARFIESNPVAAFFLNHWGVKGLLLFKFFVVAVVILICQIVATQNLMLARGVLIFATTVVTLVVIYSVWLHQSAPSGPPPEGMELPLELF